MAEQVAGFQLSDVLDHAVRLSGGTTGAAADVNSARLALRLLLEEWNAQGFRTWKIRQWQVSGFGPEVILPPEVDDVFDVHVLNLQPTGITGISEKGMRRITASAYAQLTSKTSPGQPSQFYLQRSEPPSLFVFPVGRRQLTDSETFDVYGVERPPDWDRNSNEMDLPGRWLQAAIKGVALELSKTRQTAKGKIDLERVQMLGADYEKSLDLAARGDRERTSYRIRISGV